jgi:hypothetical protein
VAQVARSSWPHPDIDYYLDYQFSKWDSVPEYAEWWPSMEPVDREVFHLEWAGITESRLQDLQQWAEQGSFTAEQQARYERLLALVAERRPTIERLLSE